MEHVEVAAKRDKKGEETRKERKREEKVKVGEEVKERWVRGGEEWGINHDVVD